MSIAAHFTRDEFLALPQSPPGVRFELLDGELVTMNDPLPVHQKAVVRIVAALVAWCDANLGRGQVLLPIDTEVGEATIFGPDLQWFAGDRELPSERSRPWPVGDVVIEVASSSTERYDAEVKVGRYLAAGAGEVWLVSLAPVGVRIVRRAADGVETTNALGLQDVLASPLLPGFAFPLAALAR